MPSVGTGTAVKPFAKNGPYENLKQEALHLCWQVVLKLLCMLSVSRAHFHPTLYKMNGNNKTQRARERMGEKILFQVLLVLREIANTDSLHSLLVIYCR